ncbi:MAG TPA: AMP-binding protein [Vicinamibacterales bacterium]|nr:AMP-binding protein [Vicinamibacterales bacterium]
MPPGAPWLAHYDAGVRPALEYPARTLLDYLAEHARDRPAAPALLYKGATVTYGGLQAASDAFACALRALGVARGDRVGLLLPNCPQFLIAEIGAWKIGAIAAPINPSYTEAEIEGPLRDLGVETVVVLTRFYGRVKAIQPRTPVRRVIATSIKEYFPAHLRVLFTLLRERGSGDRVTLAPGDSDFAHLLLVNRGRRPPPPPVTPDDPAILLLSGGTTGTPKAAAGRHSAYVCAGLQVQEWLASVLSGNDVHCLPLPLFHVYANVGVQSLAIINGDALSLVPNPRDVDDLVATLRRVKPSFFTGVPALYIALLKHAAVVAGKIDFKSIKLCVSGASALLAETRARFESLTGGRIVEGYSLTEAMMALVVNPVRGENKAGSVGMPLPDVLVRVVDAEDGTRELDRNDVGEIAIAAPQLMQGYWGQAGETQQMLREDGAGRRWLYTGDLGYLDADGYLFIVDRKKDLIKTSGFQVWPREIEEVLAAHPAVGEVGVAGVPDPVRGEVVKAWVVLRADTGATDGELRAFCRERLAGYKVPATVEFRTELPKTMVGKVMRRALREDG